MKVFYLIVFIFSCLSISAQEKLEFGDTGTTTKSPKYKPKDKEYKERKPIEIVKNSPKGLLIGNPCMEEVFSDMGFRYVIQTKNRAVAPAPYGYMNEFDRFWHNLVAKVRMIFKNGPFWKIKLNKKRKECRELSSDFVG